MRVEWTSYTGTSLLFEINMDGKFTRNERLVVDRHTTAPPPLIKNSNLVSRERVRIALLLESLNDLEIFTYEIGNSYLNSKCREELCTETGT